MTIRRAVLLCLLAGSIPAAAQYDAGDRNFTVASSSATATPTFAPASGYSGSATTVTISDATSGASIVYCQDTTNACTPSTSYSAPVSVSSTGYLRAQATASGHTSSSVASAAYTIGGGTPTFGSTYAYCPQTSSAVSSLTLSTCTGGGGKISLNAGDSALVQCGASGSGVSMTPTSSPSMTTGVTLSNTGYQSESLTQLIAGSTASYDVTCPVASGTATLQMSVIRVQGTLTNSAVGGPSSFYWYSSGITNSLSNTARAVVFACGNAGYTPPAIVWSAGTIQGVTPGIVAVSASSTSTMAGSGCEAAVVPAASSAGVTFGLSAGNAQADIITIGY